MQLERREAANLHGNTLVNNVNTFIVSVILAFTLFNLPRALAYIANNRSGAFQGYLLGSSTQLRMYHRPSGSALEPEEKGQSRYHIPTLESSAPSKRRWHSPVHFSLRNPSADFMQYPIVGNYSVLQLLIMAGYIAALAFPVFYKSNPFPKPHRSGWVTASQIPFVYALATKNNAIGLLVGVGYEKLNYLHRHLGRMMVIGANVHGLGFLYKWWSAGNISKKISEPEYIWGVTCLVCFDLLGFFSVETVRRNCYNFFFITHAVGFIGLLFAAYLHQPDCLPYIIGCSVIYGLDHIIRTIKTRFSTATIRTIPELGVTRVDIPSLNTGWRAGQHVRLRVLSTNMGLWGMMEEHPFTISSATNTEEGLVLICKKTGNWTRKLYEMAETTASGEQGDNSHRKVKVMIQGPYGGVGDTTVSNFSGAMFIVGGSGVAFAMSAVQDLVLVGDQSRTEIIEVVWRIANPAALENFVPLFSALVSQSDRSRLRVSVFYTRATNPPFGGLELPQGITLTPGHPNIAELIDGFVTSMVNKGNGAHGAFIAVCGPASLSKDVARAVKAHGASSKKAIGGVHFHEDLWMVTARAIRRIPEELDFLAVINERCRRDVIYATLV